MQLYAASKEYQGIFTFVFGANLYLRRAYE
jgi:hypothetical protein